MNSTTLHEVITIDPYNLTDENALLLSNLIYASAKPGILSNESMYRDAVSNIVVRLTNSIKILNCTSTKTIKCLILANIADSIDDEDESQQDTFLNIFTFDPEASYSDQLLLAALSYRDDILTWDKDKAYITKLLYQDSNSILRLKQSLVKTSDPISIEQTFSLINSDVNLISFYKISTTNLTPPHKNKLVEILSNNPDSNIYPGICIEANTKKIAFLSNPIISDSDKALGHKKIFHILDNIPFARGGISKLYTVIDTLELALGNLISIPWRPLALKVSNVKPTGHSYSNLDYIKNEYKHSRLLPHLRPQLPIVDKHNSYMLMNKLPGMDLFDFFAKVINSKLNTNFRFKLGICLLETYKKQVHAWQMNHFDIKPENIIANINNNSIPPNPELMLFDPKQVELNFIDYSFARPFNAVLPSNCGSPEYASPEMLRGLCRTFADEKADIYSLGICLGYVWGFILTGGHIVFIDKNCSSATHDRLYTDIAPSFSFYFLSKITFLINSMTLHSPISRFSLEKSLSYLYKVYEEYQASIDIEPEFYGLKNKAGPVFFSGSTSVYANNAQIHTYQASLNGTN